MPQALTRLNDLRRLAGERSRALAERARLRLQPAWAGAAGWTRGALEHEAAPLRLGRPGLAEKITGGVFLVVVAALIAFLLLFDWNMLRGPIGRWASARWERQVELNGDLEVDLSAGPRGPRSTTCASARPPGARAPTRCGSSNCAAPSNCCRCWPAR